jgi:uncharacterized protein (TIGR03067 family)
MRTHLLLAVIAVVSLAFAPAPFPRRERGKDDSKKIEGTWLRLSCSGGSLPPVPRPINDVVVITGNRIFYKSSNSTWILTLGTAGPRTFDLTRPEGGRVGAWIGVYEIDGDTMRICFTSSTERPRGIQPTRTGEFLQTFRRQKP